MRGRAGRRCDGFDALSRGSWRMSVPGWLCLAVAALSAQPGAVGKEGWTDCSTEWNSQKLLLEAAHTPGPGREEAEGRGLSEAYCPCQRVTWDLPPPAGVSEPSLHLPTPASSLANGNLEQARRESGEQRPLSPGDPGRSASAATWPSPSTAKSRPSLSHVLGGSAFLVCFTTRGEGVIYQPSPSHYYPIL